VPATTSQAVAPRQQTAVVAADELADFGFDVADNMEGVEPRLPVIKIVAQGQAFTMPDDSLAKSVEGIIIETHRTNAWWPKSGDATPGNLPPCASMDAVRPQPDCADPQAKSCAECPMNRYGSGSDANGAPSRGKACKNSRRVYILLDGHEIPYLLTLPPSSLKSFDEYAVNLTDRKRPIPTVRTKITLVKAENGSSQIYSKAVFTMLAEINDRGALGKILTMKRQLADTVRHQAITAEEYAGEDVDKDAAAFSGSDPF
jgi:hypothetical protein